MLLGNLGPGNFTANARNPRYEDCFSRLISRKVLRLKLVSVFLWIVSLESDPQKFYCKKGKRRFEDFVSGIGPRESFTAKIVSVASMIFIFWIRFPKSFKFVHIFCQGYF